MTKSEKKFYKRQSDKKHDPITLTIPFKKKTNTI